MRIAKHLGLSVANIEAIDVNGRQLIVVERYDRIVHADGSVERMQQEDLCQATSTPPSQKYEEDGGPSLQRIARILRDNSSSESVESLLRAVIVNVLIGNGDAHAKNYSLLNHPLGALRLAPLYDVMSTLYYGDDRLAMYIDNLRRTDHVTANRIVNEATSWGLSRGRATEIVSDIIDRSPAALAAAEDETNDLPREIPGLVRSQLKLLGSDLGAAPTAGGG